MSGILLFSAAGVFAETIGKVFSSACADSFSGRIQRVVVDRRHGIEVMASISEGAAFQAAQVGYLYVSSPPPPTPIQSMGVWQLPLMRQWKMRRRERNHVAVFGGCGGLASVCLRRQEGIPAIQDGQHQVNVLPSGALTRRNRGAICSSQLPTIKGR